MTPRLRGLRAARRFSADYTRRPDRTREKNRDAPTASAVSLQDESEDVSVKIIRRIVTSKISGSWSWLSLPLLYAHAYTHARTCRILSLSRVLSRHRRHDVNASMTVSTDSFTQFLR